MTPLTGLSGAAAEIYASINGVQTLDDLDHLARLVWKGNAEGTISDDDATLLVNYIEHRRPLGRSSPQGHLKPAGVSAMRFAGRVGSRFMPRQRPRSPNRKASRDRRRMLGGSSILPHNLRHHYTEGQRAVLCIIAGEVKRRGFCYFPIDKIAALAGVCRTTVQTTLHEARRLSHIKITERPMPGRKHLSNLINITSQEWRKWLMRAPSASRPIGSKPVILGSTTKSKEKKEAVD